MRIGICVAALVLAGWVAEAAAELRILTIPGNDTWANIQQRSVSQNTYLELVEFERYEGGIAPIRPERLVSVPDVPLSLTAADVDAETDSVLLEFSTNVARLDVVAAADVSLEDGTTLTAGTVLIPQWTSFPRSVEAVQLLRRAGITEVEAMINVAESFPRPPGADKFNKALNLTTFGRFEGALTGIRLQQGLGRVFDGDPLSSFERIDRVGQDVSQQWSLYVDFGHYFPIRLFRCFPRVEEPVRVSSYIFSRGLRGTEQVIAGLSLEDPDTGPLGFPEFIKIGETFPTFVPAASVPANVEDTIAVLFDPPTPMRYSRMEFKTPLDYDLAEMEYFADGFVPRAVYNSNALPVPKATLGRIFWDEEKIGDPTKSRAIVRVRTGGTTEANVYYRVNFYDRQVEWVEEGAIVVDRRIDSPTNGQAIDLEAAEFNLAAREIYSAASSADREAIRISREDYTGLPVSVRRGIAPDLEFWTSAQQANSGELINAPSGRPFIQIEVEFESDSPDAGTIVRNMRIEYSAPQITDQVLGEIAPAVDVAAGSDTSFVLVLKASVGAENSGFNRLQVFTPARVEAIEGIEVDLGDGQVVELTSAGTGAGDAVEGQFRELLVDDNQFVVSFPTIGGDGELEALVTARFRGRVINFHTRFSASVYLDTLSTDVDRQFSNDGILALSVSEDALDTLAYFLPQRVEGDDVVDFGATDQLSDRNSLVVLADVSSQGDEVVGNFDVAPNPFTPNGDGINDEMMVLFDLQRLLAPRSVRVEIFDLTGRRLHHAERQLASGGYSQPWDGRDDGGILVPPGLYILRVSVEADDAESVQMRVVSVAY
ncbi:MAG: hypothetical protein HOM68_03270 [Gemmatimonadetes bacterium]|jgi:hypothetical protein|nr:hypothetical protein [Gemmatimonadota bacterium]MBT5141823.1 hypothetical protein [Gemmatimonadota bacterium]MBT5588673.1 hypothetical protein [Gemmatimonadota bacterium]MBT5962541.1 hypothetical protein [Gemmatimonadota bacterium]